MIVLALAVALSADIVALERKGMDGWLGGSPDAALEMMDPQITYLHFVSEKRLEGVAAVKALFEGYRGMPLFDSYEIVQPKVQEAGDVAILTYLLVTRNGGVTRKSNATQVYQKKKEGWRVIHSHFSANNPPQQ
jgi:ketosteroid isomerase-like protein